VLDSLELVEALPTLKAPDPVVVGRSAAIHIQVSANFMLICLPIYSLMHSSITRVSLLAKGRIASWNAAAEGGIGVGAVNFAGQNIFARIYICMKKLAKCVKLHGNFPKNTFPVFLLGGGASVPHVPRLLRL